MRDFKKRICTPWPVPVDARTKAWFCGRSLVGIAGSNPAGDMDVFLL